MKMKYSVAVTFAAVALTLPCSAPSEEAHHQAGDTTVSTNTFCPVLPKERTSINYSATYEGRTVYFCCNSCRTKFMNNPMAYLARLPQFMQSSPEMASSGPLPKHQHTSPHGLKRFLGAFHPLAVHFPIALLMTALLAEIIFIWKHTPTWAVTTEFLVWLGAAGAVAAAALGGLAAMREPYTGELARVFTAHRALGVGAMLSAILAACLCRRAHQAKSRAATVLYRSALVGSVLGVGAAGHLGALLVYGLNHFRW